MLSRWIGDADERDILARATKRFQKSNDKHCYGDNPEVGGRKQAGQYDGAYETKETNAPPHGDHPRGSVEHMSANCTIRNFVWGSHCGMSTRATAHPDTGLTFAT